MSFVSTNSRVGIASIFRPGIIAILCGIAVVSMGHASTSFDIVAAVFLLSLCGLQNQSQAGQTSATDDSGHSGAIASATP